MPNLDRKYDRICFPKATTFRNSYQTKEPIISVPINYGVIHEKHRKPRAPFVPIKDIHALTPWRDPSIRFDVFHKPDPIVRSDPRKMQEPYEELPDEDREEVQKSRPKVLMKSPAIDLDAVQEPDRKMFIDHIYTTTTSIAQRMAVADAKFKNIRAPLQNSYSKCRPLFIEPLKEPYVSPEWRMDTVTWDEKQLRAYVVPTRAFWLGREKPYVRRHGHEKMNKTLS